MLLPPFPRKKDPFHYVSQTFLRTALRAVFSALDTLFFPSCELHVLPVVLTFANQHHT